MRKLFLPLLAAALALCAGSPRAALTTTIAVTTTADDDGTNPATCSLREAVKAINTLQPYGGCPAGVAFTDNQIQLDAATYILTQGELYVTRDIVIVGKDSQQTAHAQVADPLTGVKPRQFRPDYVDADPAIGKIGSYMVATPGHRMFNNSSLLTMRNLVLEGSTSPAQSAPAAVADNGGIIFATAGINLSNVIVRGGGVTGATAAAGNGGAIYLAGDGASLTLTDSTIEDSHADNKGGAVAMECSSGLNPFVQHTLTITRALFRMNDAGVGAGAIEACGNSYVGLTASTLSANSSGSTSGALAYVQGSAVGLGTISLSYVTAAEQPGHVLAGNGLAAVTITGSLLAAFDTSSATAVCFNPSGTAVNWQSSAGANGTFNAYTDDGSCDPLMQASGNNVKIAPGTPLQNVLVPIAAEGSYYPTTASGRPFGLTDYYLPKVVAGSPVLDMGQPIGNCSGNDQRNVDRRSGTACDIGATERLQITARDDTAESMPDTDRLAIVDVLANDSYGEDDTAGPYQFANNSDAAHAPVVLVNDDGGRCQWKLGSDPTYPGKLVVQNLDNNGQPNGALTPDVSPIVCTYQVVDTKPETSVTIGTVKVKIKNQAPNALNDNILRPVGQQSVTFNPLDNDNDKGDGKFGLVLNPDGSYGPAVDWATFYPVEIVDQPSLGKIYGASSGLCPGSAAVPKICVNPPLRYVADNNMSPFTDTFSYHVYDQDGQTSNSATVSIYTNAPDPDHGGGAGSLDWLTGAALGLLGLRRLRRL